MRYNHETGRERNRKRDRLTDRETGRETDKLRDKETKNMNTRDLSKLQSPSLVT